MDDQQLSELFQAAAQEVPPASFDEHDVASASRRVTVRRRSVLAGGSGLVVVVLAVGLLLGTGVLGHTVGNGGASAASAGVAEGPSHSSLPFGRLAEPAPGDHGQQDFPESSPMQGGVGTGRVGHGADSTHAGCGPADGELAVALASELPSAGAQVPIPAEVTCPPNSRSAAVAVPHGVAVAVLVPRADQTGPTRPGVTSASGSWVVTVVSEPAAAVPAQQLSAAMVELAGRF